MTNFNELVKSIKGKSVPAPHSGTLSGHAAGEPFDKIVEALLKQQVGEAYVYRQYEYLNFIYKSHPSYTTYEQRLSLISPSALSFLLSRGREASVKWSQGNMFTEKQNDTADILVNKGNPLEIVDVKTRNLNKDAQPPNIISAFKLARAVAKMIDDEEYEKISIIYFQVDWVLTTDRNSLECVDACYGELFREHPSSLYINWAAAMQIQFHVNCLEQDYRGSTKEWAKLYLRHFTEGATRHSAKVMEKFVQPFERYLD